VGVQSATLAAEPVFATPPPPPPPGIPAAKWAAQNTHLLPIDSRPIAPPLKPQEERLASASPIASGPVPTGPELSVATELSVPVADPWSEKIVIDREG
jgi:hypothetical protein